MKELVKISNGIIRKLDKKEQVREQALARSREINRHARAIIQDIHRSRDVKSNFKMIKTEVGQLNSLLKNYPDLMFAGFTVNALQEYAEASVFYSITSGTTIPSPEELGIDHVPYALALGDVVGELRRLTLNMLIENDLDSAKSHFRAMEKLTEILFKFNYPDGLIPIRRKQDVARNLLEKTQGELATAISTQSLERKLDKKIA